MLRIFTLCSKLYIDVTIKTKIDIKQQFKNGNNQGMCYALEGKHPFPEHRTAGGAFTPFQVVGLRTLWMENFNHFSYRV
jgi:hypothetical protein